MAASNDGGNLQLFAKKYFNVTRCNIGNLNECGLGNFCRGSQNAGKGLQRVFGRKYFVNDNEHHQSDQHKSQPNQLGSVDGPINRYGGEIRCGLTRDGIKNRGIHGVGFFSQRNVVEYAILEIGLRGFNHMSGIIGIDPFHQQRQNREQPE